MMCATGHFPKVWRGAWISNIYKHKGEEAECGNWRGIQVCGNPVKVVCGWLQSLVSPALRKCMGSWQFGLPRMGTLLANHTLRVWMQVCSAMGWSILVLFVDLEKAFDRVCRQLVCGWLDGEEAGPDTLVRCGFEQTAAVNMARRISQGTVLDQVGVTGAPADLLRSLHSGCWAQIGRQSTTRFVTKRGGRQGCTFGPDLFSAAYELPLADTRADVQARGCTVSAPAPVGAFWSRQQHSDPVVGDVPAKADGEGPEMVGSSMVVYVDDLGLMVAAPTPHQLMAQAPGCIDDLANHFASFDMVMNHGPNKTEAFVRLCGKNQAEFKASIADAGHAIVTPQGRSIRVVEEYVHLGSTTSAMLNDNVDVNRRCSIAKQTLSALGEHIFGNPMFSAQLRLGLGKALVLSRLQYGVHLWGSLSAWALRSLNAVYMSLLRRIAGQSWMGLGRG